MIEKKLKIEKIYEARIKEKRVKAVYFGKSRNGNLLNKNLIVYSREDKKNGFEAWRFLNYSFENNLLIVNEGRKKSLSSFSGLEKEFIESRLKELDFFKNSK